MRSPFHVVVLCFGVIAGLSVPANAQGAPQLQQTKATADQKAGFPLHASVSLTQNIGSGTFVASPFNPTVSTQLTMAPSLSWQGFNFGLSQTLGMEWTQSDGTTYAHQVEMSDIGLSAGSAGWALDDLNLSLAPSLGLQLPVSLAARQAGSLGTPSLAARASWRLPEQGFAFYVKGSTGYTILVPALATRFANQPSKPFTDDLGRTVATDGCNTRNPAELLNYACGGLTSGFRWSTGLGASWSGFNDQLAVNLDLGYGQAFSIFVSPDDEFTAERAVPGAGLRQSTSGNLSATYAPATWFLLTAGISSFQGAFAENGTTPRFPLWDFVSPFNNFSSVYVDTTFNF